MRCEPGKSEDVSDAELSTTGTLDKKKGILVQLNTFALNNHLELVHADGPVSVHVDFPENISQVS